MKNFIKVFFVTLSVFIVTSCSTEDKTIDVLFDTIERGAVLRTISFDGNSFNISDPSSAWTVNLEEQDAQNGGLFQEIKLYARLVDNTPDNGTTPPTEGLVKTIPASSFSSAGTPFGLPRGAVSATFQEALDAMGILTSDVDGGDAVLLRLELVLTDGRVYTNNAAGTIAGGTFYRSPFQYSAAIVCGPVPPAVGDWIFDMEDAYGDSWNGASLTVTLDGVATQFLVDETEATASVETLTVPTGTQVISIKFNSGTFDGEVGFTVTSANGNVIVEKIPYGAATPANAELINYCIQNY